MQKPIAAAVIALASIAPAHAVEVYRCFINGVARYQDKPCSGMVININTDKTGVGNMRDSELSAYLDAVERDVSRIGLRQSQQLETVNSHLTILRQIVD